MVNSLIKWAVGNSLVVLLLAVILAGVGGYAFWNVNVEAYPDPAPAIIEVVAQYPGFSAEEVERQVTIPLEVALAGMPGLTNTRTKSLAGLSHLRNQFEYGVDYYKARQEVINRLATLQGLPSGVNPQISPFTPTGELMRYSIDAPRDAAGRDVYSLYDLKSLQDWVLEREFRRLPRIADVTGFGGMVKRYEVHPDPDRLRAYGIPLGQLTAAIPASNQNVGVGYLRQGPNAENVRGVALFGRGLDPVLKVLNLTDPDSRAVERLRRAEAEGRPEAARLREEQRRRIAVRAADVLRTEEDQRLEEIREVVVATVNGVPRKVQDLVSGGPVNTAAGEIGSQGVVVGAAPRLGKVSISRPRTDASGKEVRDADGKRVWADEEDKVQGVILMRKNEETLPALTKVKEKLDELNNTPGRMLPGVQIRPHFDLTGLIHRTTETVEENLLTGMALVTIILLMFLSNVRSALIVAVNIPLALLVAFTILFLRGKSANLLSIGAVDFGIIVDSSVIMVENVYRHISSGELSRLPLKDRILRASREVQMPLLFSTLIMVCAFIPLFTMKGPEGQIFGPMADTYAFALGGALLLAMVLSPVLCLLFFKHLKPARDNFLVRWLRRGYLRQVNRFLDHRELTLAGFLVAAVVTFYAGWNFLGREFMPELEEGNVYVRGTMPVNVSLEESAEMARRARVIVRDYPEVALVQSQVGRPDDGTDPTGFYNVEFSIPLIPEKDWPAVVEQTGWRKWLWGARRPRTKSELVKTMNEDLDRHLIGIDWNFSQYIRDNVMESLSGVKGDNSVKIIGPDLDELERIAARVKATLDHTEGVENAGVFRIKGQPNLELYVDKKRCALWGVRAQDVQNAIAYAVGGQAVSQMIEGERTFDVTVRWPEKLRDNLVSILDIPVEVANVVTPGSQPASPQTPVTGPSQGPNTGGYGNNLPAIGGAVGLGTFSTAAAVPRVRLGQLVVDAAGRSEGDAEFVRPGASTVYREQGKRLIAVKFSVRGRDLAGAVAEAQQAVRDQGLVPPPYVTEWSGEFEEMEAAERRLMLWIPVSLGLVCVLVYLAFKSVLDMVTVLMNVVALSMGGVWALLLTGTNFSISAAVGFISIFGVAIMDGLLSVSYFNALRAHGHPLREAILEGAGRRVRPMMMTALTAIFGLLPAAFSTKIGSQTQRPLAIVVVGGMVMTLLLNRYLMPVLYSFYGHREPPAGAGGMAH